MLIFQTVSHEKWTEVEENKRGSGKQDQLSLSPGQAQNQYQKESVREDGRKAQKDPIKIFVL